ncbi:ATP-dependent helicase [Tautonia sociabilis]|uniref:DNA 3'-5' helicase n=1 Tax=Tautonia sociabilis TaxID=2080755 RepID=A0A432MDA2_9BACT|nr:ATP-dependent helicase [Tautonia sociabilis]RUL81894.1 ImmA/IrrE family metallo-endopeptidase [Tautonia sociabilis]
MSAWSEVRRLARLRHAELAPSTDDLVPATVLLDAAEALTGVRRCPRPPGDALLDGAEASYDRERLRIYYSREIEPALANFYVAHEFGHHWLDGAGASCGSLDLDVATPAEPETSLVGDADPYNPKERTEAQANLFARELLLPRDKLRRRCSDGTHDAAMIASELKVPVDLVMHQMADALLLPADVPEEDVDLEERPPDESQREAIRAPRGPRQVRAGPGSGKTRTLVGRVVHLLASGEEPSSILALTYSNASAQDLAARIRAAIGPVATAVWSGTFHAYGRELLRKYGEAIGLPLEPTLLDRTDSLMLLEELLPELQLDHYLDLRDPVLKLRAIFGAICRAKDELASPEDYMRHAAAARAGAGDPKELEAADRAIEVARVYAVYEQALRSRGLVDFGDLVARSVELLRAHPSIREELRAAKRHILVDEYQDMNRASGLLLKELVEPGGGPWVVGDVRQAIYRFRGASPLNMSRFGAEFPGACTTDLSVSYRSGGKIVRTFEAFGRKMSTARLSSQGPLAAQRGEEAGEVIYEIASTREAEAFGIANAILARVAAGDRFGNHAILGRTHTILARVAAHLERSGVPCLYFGDFFERPEIRDLLALISLASEPRGVGLLRVAQMPQYAIPPDDIVAVFAWRRAQHVVMLAALRRYAEIDGISDIGRAGLGRIADDLDGVDWPMTPHRFLMHYLFRRGTHLALLLEEASVAGQQRRLAVYQLLQFAFSFKPPPGTDPKRSFLEHVRRLEILDEEKQLRQVPAGAAGIDAVRLMTIHASKGLEFPNVYIPSLTARHFPSPGRPEECPLPAGLIDPDSLMSRDAEEESLFFVALSRACDTLYLSRALTNGGASTKNPSRYMAHIAAHLTKALDGPVAWVEEGAAEPAWPTLVARPIDGEWSYRAIETYLECPRRYYYEFALELSGGEESSPYLKFQSALHATLSWMRETTTAEERCDGLGDRFREDWARFGPQGDAFERLYRQAAERMLKNALDVMGGAGLATERRATLPSSGAVIRCRADHIEASAREIVIRRLKASRLAKKEKAKPRYALWLLAVQCDHPGCNISFEHVSLVNRERQIVAAKPQSLQEQLSAIEAAIEAISAGRFDPRPTSFCPTCPYYFVCPTHGRVH